MIKERYARFAAFMIDAVIVNMFVRILFQYIFVQYVYFTFTNIFADIATVIFYMLLFVGVNVLYQLVCFRLIQNSLGKQLLGLRYYIGNGMKIDQVTLMRREFIKQYLLYATLLTYGLYSFFRIVMRSEKQYVPYHDRKMGTYVTWK